MHLVFHSAQATPVLLHYHCVQKHRPTGKYFYSIPSHHRQVSAGTVYDGQDIFAIDLKAGTCVKRGSAASKYSTQKPKLGNFEGLRTLLGNFNNLNEPLKLSVHVAPV